MLILKLSLLRSTLPWVPLAPCLPTAKQLSRAGVPPGHPRRARWTCPPPAQATGHGPNMPTRQAQGWACPRGVGTKNGHVPRGHRLQDSLKTGHAPKDCPARVCMSSARPGQWTWSPYAHPSGLRPGMSPRVWREERACPPRVQAAGLWTGHVLTGQPANPLNHFDGRLPQGADRRMMGAGPMSADQLRGTVEGTAPAGDFAVPASCHTCDKVVT